MAITDAMIRQAKPTEKQYKLTESHGLFLLVKPIGSKSCVTGTASREGKDS